MANPTNGTARYFLDYGFGGDQTRTLQVRYEAPATAADVAGWLEVMLGILEPTLLTDWSVLGARVAALGSNVTLPSVAPASPAGGGGTVLPVLYPRFIAFQGRDATSGAKSRLSIYGSNLGIDDGYRYTRGENSVVDDLLDFVQTPVAGVNISILGNVVQWYDYMNCGMNSYHQRAQRS